FVMLPRIMMASTPARWTRPTSSCPMRRNRRYCCMCSTSQGMVKGLGCNRFSFQLILYLFFTRFEANTPRYIWISEEAVQTGGPLSVNITCFVYADPVAKISWLHGLSRTPVQPTGRQPGPNNLRVDIADNENMSVLTLHYKSIDEIKNPRHNSRIKYECK